MADTCAQCGMSGLCNMDDGKNFPTSPEHRAARGSAPWITCCLSYRPFSSTTSFWCSISEHVRSWARPNPRMWLWAWAEQWVFVMLMATGITWPIQRFILDPSGIGYLQTIVFIFGDSVAGAVAWKCSCENSFPRSTTRSACSCRSSPRTAPFWGMAIMCHARVRLSRVRLFHLADRHRGFGRGLHPGIAHHQLHPGATRNRAHPRRPSKAYPSPWSWPESCHWHFSPSRGMAA